MSPPPATPPPGPTFMGVPWRGPSAWTPQRGLHHAPLPSSGILALGGPRKQDPEASSGRSCPFSVCLMSPLLAPCLWVPTLSLRLVCPRHRQSWATPGGSSAPVRLTAVSTAPGWCTWAWPGPRAPRCRWGCAPARLRVTCDLPEDTLKCLRKPRFLQEPLRPGRTDRGGEVGSDPRKPPAGPQFRVPPRDPAHSARGSHMLRPQALQLAGPELSPALAQTRP